MLKTGESPFVQADDGPLLICCCSARAAMAQARPPDGDDDVPANGIVAGETYLPSVAY